VSVLPARDHGHPAHQGSAGRICPGVGHRFTGDGELLLRGPCVMAGYWNAPAQSAAVLSDGWFSTGDVGFVDPDGFLHIVDRTGDVIISGGFNVYPAEVERVIETLDGVKEAAVLRVPHERWGEAVAAVVVRAPGGCVAAADVVRVCRDNLAAYKKPLLVEFAERLPYTGTGKVSRRELRELYWPMTDGGR
jgi:acyl-CoA synthetase (AMP-forming)/AMP-acid ligase II